MSRKRRSALHNRPWGKGDKAIAYLRVSKVGDRGEDLISDDVQADVIRRWAEREGVEIIDTVTDLDKSGREDTKRQIGKTIDRVRRGEAQGIVVWKVSRWGRNLVDSMLNIAELQEAGGFIASGTESLDEIETPMGKFSLTQMLAIAQLQSDQIGETWQNIHDYRRTLGLPHTGGPRFGYDYNEEVKSTVEPGKVFTPNAVTGPWLARAYRDFIAGKPAARICKDLHDNGIRSVNGRPIVYRALMSALDSGFGAGLIVDKRGATSTTSNPNLWEFSPGAHQPVISMEEWEAYKRRRADRRPAREKAATSRLSGLVYCGACRRKMVLHYSKKNADGTVDPNFRCQLVGGYFQSTQKCPAPTVIRKAALEDVVLDWLGENFEGEEAHATAQARESRASQARADVEAIEADITRLQKRLSRLTDMLLDEDDPDARETFRDKQREMRQEMNDLKAQRDALQVEATISDIPTRDAFGALTAAWRTSQEAMLNEALRQVIGRVEVVRGDRNDPASRVTILGRWEVDDAEPVRSMGAKAKPQSYDDDEYVA